MAFWKRQAPKPPAEDIRETVEGLRVELRALRRDVDDLDDSLRRFRGRRVKTEALDEDAPLDKQATNGKGRVPFTIAQLRAQGRMPW